MPMAASLSVVRFPSFVTLTSPPLDPFPPEPPTVVDRLMFFPAPIPVAPPASAPADPPVPPPPPMDCAKIANEFSPSVRMDPVFAIVTTPPFEPDPPEPPIVVAAFFALTPPSAPLSARAPLPPPPPMDCAKIPHDVPPVVRIDPF